MDTFEKEMSFAINDWKCKTHYVLITFILCFLTSAAHIYKDQSSLTSRTSLRFFFVSSSSNTTKYTLCHFYALKIKKRVYVFEIHFKHAYSSL